MIVTFDRNPHLTEDQKIDSLARSVQLALNEKADKDTASQTFVDKDTAAQYVIKSALLDMVHPVGSYYETSDATFDPNATWGGTWVLEANGESSITDSGWLTLVNTNGRIIYRKIGKTVFVNGYGLQVTHNVVRATLPEGFRPDQRTTVAAAFPINKQTYANITTDGGINPIINGGGSESNWYFQAVFSTGEGESSGTNRWHRTA